MSCKVKYCRFSNYHITLGHRCGKCKQYGHGQVECNNLSLKNELWEESKEDFLEEKDYCKIKDCEHKKTHKTKSHECSICFSKNHSKLNCDKNPENNIKLECPLCLTSNNVSLIDNLIYGLEEKCKACMMNPVEILLPQCKHAVLCKDCCKEINSEKLNYEIIDELNLINNFSFIKNIGDLFKKKTNIPNPYCKIVAGMGCILFVRKNINTNKFEGFFMHNDSWGQYGPKTDERPFLNDFIKNYQIIDC
uniref:RING-type domain-containing protein n=1 Tax=viral metagenome TaxID=1070528 RepID=A0A6C0IXM2_9ZZZZ